MPRASLMTEIYLFSFKGTARIVLTRITKQNLQWLKYHASLRKTPVVVMFNVKSAM